jgi:hypothetical protein
MMMPMRTRITILIVAIPGLLDMTWILERFLALPVSLRNPSLLLLELPLLMVLLSVVMWSFAIRTLTYRGTVGLVVVSGFLLLSGLLRLGMIVAAPLDDPLLKPHLFEISGLVFGSLILGIEAESGRRYFARIKEKSLSNDPGVKR